jgi:hypothetical protein
MNKLLTTVSVILSIVFSPALRADIAASEDTSSPSEMANDSSPTEIEGTPVGAAANEGSNTAKKKQWQNIALAAGAVAVAVTALILVSTNDGHHAHKGDSKE